jgi:alanine dehydrogenase
MIIGIPKEIKSDENRISITPAGVHRFIDEGHEIIIEKNAGIGSGITDEEFIHEGAKILASAEEIFKNAEMIIKVKEPQPVELDMLQEDQILYTYLHLAPARKITIGLNKNKVIGIAYETIEVGKKLPLLEPMSEIAGKMSSLMGAYYSAKPYGGRGMLAGGVAGVHSAKFLIIGGGTAGINAAKIAAGLGARVVIMDVNLERMRYLEDVLPKNCETIMSDKVNLEKEVIDADVIIGTVLIPGAKTPKLINREMLSSMTPGAVIVDVSIDQGGCTDSSRPTTHADPVYIVDSIVHYCVANMPGAYARTSTFALTNATLPFGIDIANKGWCKAAKESLAIAKGINTACGHITYQPVAEANDLPYKPLEELL